MKQRCPESRRKAWSQEEREKGLLCWLMQTTWVKFHCQHQNMLLALKMKGFDIYLSNYIVNTTTSGDITENVDNHNSTASENSEDWIDTTEDTIADTEEPFDKLSPVTTEHGSHTVLESDYEASTDYFDQHTIGGTCELNW